MVAMEVQQGLEALYCGAPQYRRSTAATVLPPTTGPTWVLHLDGTDILEAHDSIIHSHWRL